MQNNMSSKGTVQQYKDEVIKVRTILSGFRQELTIFKQLVMKSINVLRKLKGLVDSTGKNMSMLADCIQKQLDCFVEGEVCKAAMEEGTITMEHLCSKVRQKNVSLIETIQHQNDILFDVRINFSGIRQGIIIFEEFMENSVDILQKTKDRIFTNDNTFSILSIDIKKRINELVEVSEAAMEGNMSAEQPNYEVMQKIFLTKEKVKLLNHVLAIYHNNVINFRKSFTRSLEFMENSIGVVKRMKETLVSNENELSNVADGSQKPLDQFVGCDYKAAVKRTISAEQLDIKGTPNKVLTKEAVQIQNDKLLTVRTNLICIRQKIILFDENMMTTNDMLQTCIENITLDENKLSIHVDNIQTQQDNLI